MNNPSISNPPTSFPTAQTIASIIREYCDLHEVYPSDDNAEVAARFILEAMHKASPSTEAVERLVEKLREPRYISDEDHARTPDDVLNKLQEFRRERDEAADAITSLTSPAVVEDPHKVCPACMEPECDFDCDGPYDEAVLNTPANKEGGECL